MPFQPGTHIIASLQTQQPFVLQTFGGFKELCNELVAKHALHKLGEVFHNFQPAGFTGVICLSESHISVHTFPEYNRVNVDIYLSNYLKENDGTVQAIYTKVIRFFGATVIDEIKIKR